MLEVGTGPELKEGYYVGEEIPEDHPYFVQKKLNSGPNQWPPTVPDKEEFKRTTMEYYHAVFDLAKDVLGALALTLDVSEDYFDSLTDGAVATMRYLHYPAQPKDADEKLNRGIGAHTDFGCITLLLQDEVDGLQVLDAPTGEWLDVSFLLVSCQGCEEILTGEGRTRARSLRRQPGQPVHAHGQRPVQIQHPPGDQQVRQGAVQHPFLLQREPGLPVRVSAQLPAAGRGPQVPPDHGRGDGDGVIQRELR